MYFIQAADPNSTAATAISLVNALAPAFAAGFAIQRLLEILDPIFSQIFRGEGEENANRKKAVLGLIALIIGLGLAILAKLHVLQLLGATGVPDFVDYLVTGLIISAGTEGFNSILKFLSYKKEEKKQEARAQEVAADAASARARVSTSSRAGSVRSSDETFAAREEDITVEEALEASLKAAILDLWPDKFIATKWKTTPFGNYDNHKDKIKEMVLDATVSVADRLGIVLPKAVKVNLQREIDFDTTPKAALPLMRQAIG
jgi:uncharacterized membrane protein YidH (DUF202 family)